MSKDGAFSAREAMEREKARLLEMLAAVERDIAEHDRLVAQRDQLVAKYISANAAAVIQAAAEPTAQKPASAVSDGSLGSLVRRYQTNTESSYQKLRYRTRTNYDNLLSRLERDLGATRLVEIKDRTLRDWFETWAAGGKLPMARRLIGMTRTLVNFGASVLEDGECERLSATLHRMRFSMAKPRKSAPITAEQIKAIMSKAHEMDMASIALAQALQFELMLTQKDVIGEWVPRDEAGDATVYDGDNKWLRGLRWDEIDKELVLRHTTSWDGKLLELRLSEAPLVMAEFHRIRAKCGALPTTGPMIVSEYNHLPYWSYEFRRKWRIVADAAGIPKEVKNTGSRAGGEGNGVGHLVQGVEPEAIRATEEATSVARH